MKLDVVFDAVCGRGNADSVFSVCVRQVLASGVVTIIDVSLFYTLIRAAAWGILFSSFLSFCIALALNYSLSSLYVFRHRSGGEVFRLDRFIYYFLFALVSLGLNQFIIWLLSVRLSFHPLLGKATAVATLFFWNQWIARRVIFNEKMAKKTP